MFQPGTVSISGRRRGESLRSLL